MFLVFFIFSLMILNWLKRTSWQVAAVLCVHFGCLRNTFMTLEPESDNFFRIGGGMRGIGDLKALQAFQWGRGRELFECDPSTWVHVCEWVCVCVSIFNGGKCQNSPRHVRNVLELAYLLLYHVGSRRRRHRICNFCDTRTAYLDEIIVTPS